MPKGCREENKSVMVKLSFFVKHLDTTLSSSTQHNLSIANALCCKGDCRYAVYKSHFLYHSHRFFFSYPPLPFPPLCTGKGGLKECLSENKCYPEMESWSFSCPLMHLWVPCLTSLMNHILYTLKPNHIECTINTHANTHILNTATY